MDFPLDLSLNYAVTGITEFKQSLLLLIKNSIGTFYCDSKKGSNISIHVDDEYLVENQLKQCVSQMGNTTVESLDMRDMENIKMTVKYNGYFVDFQFGLTNIG